jgi:hypothetical protein
VGFGPAHGSQSNVQTLEEIFSSVLLCQVPVCCYVLTFQTHESGRVGYGSNYEICER